MPRVTDDDGNTFPESVLDGNPPEPEYEGSFNQFLAYVAGTDNWYPYTDEDKVKFINLVLTAALSTDLTEAQRSTLRLLALDMVSGTRLWVNRYDGAGVRQARHVTYASGSHYDDGIGRIEIDGMQPVEEILHLLHQMFVDRNAADGDVDWNTNLDPHTDWCTKRHPLGGAQMCRKKFSDIVTHPNGAKARVHLNQGRHAGQLEDPRVCIEGWTKSMTLAGARELALTILGALDLVYRTESVDA